MDESIALLHYGTEIIRYNKKTESFELGDGWSVSDRDAINSFIYEVSKYYGLI
jgi:hypothetical protein